MPDRLFLFLGSLSGFLSVGAGAFGAHALKARLAPEQLVVFETAARYQMFHALALIAIAWVCSRWPGLPHRLGVSLPARMAGETG